MPRRLNNRHLLVVLLVAVLSLASCGREKIELSGGQIGLRLPDRYLIRAEVADTDAERELGLSGRAGLAQDAGVWFIFDQDDRYPFWMPDMNFAIDIVWVSSDFTITDVANSVPPEPGVPEAQLKRYINQSPARYVLEVPAGTAKAHGLKAGSKLELISS